MVYDVMLSCDAYVTRAYGAYNYRCFADGGELAELTHRSPGVWALTIKEPQPNNLDTKAFWEGTFLFHGYQHKYYVSGLPLGEREPGVYWDCLTEGFKLQQTKIVYSTSKK